MKRQQNASEEDQLKEETCEVQSSSIAQTHSTTVQMPNARHMYIQQENIYGRFIPFLLLKDKLHSQIDSSGNTALNHMCSHNSPYLPLYLSTLPQDDPILNRPNKSGHTPLDIAGLYCHKEYIELLKKKGAKDNGQVDYWAIQGANMQNWSGKVDPTLKQLIHWAAYNDLPQVLAQFIKEGASMEEIDNNNNTPFDLAMLNKSYGCIKYLAELGYRPRKHLIDNCDSLSIKKLFERLDQSSSSKNIKKMLKILTSPIFLVLNYFLLKSQNTDVNWSSASYFMIFLTIFWGLFILYPGKKEVNLDDRRTPYFKSQLLGKQINHSNLLIYITYNVLYGILGFYTLYVFSCNSHQVAFISIICFIMSCSFMTTGLAELYAIGRNLTHSELFESHKHPYLWEDICYIRDRNMLVRAFENPYDHGLCSNFKDFLGR